MLALTTDSNTGFPHHDCAPWCRAWTLALVGSALVLCLRPNDAVAQTKTLPLTPLESLGKALFFDTTLSNPPGMSCATCHSPGAGFTYPNSEINLTLGPVEGAVPGRFGKRKPSTATYSVFSPFGPVYSEAVQTFVGGVFWDGRARDLVAQAEMPTVNPNEMNNIVHNLASPELIVQKLKAGPNGKLFAQVYGPDIYSLPAQEIFNLIAGDIARYEASPEVCQFSSKYDAFLDGKAQLNPSELNGLRLVTGSVTGRPGGPPNYKSAQCVLCHGIPSDPTTGPDVWSLYCYVNIGVPRNPNNPFYKETNAQTNPLGYNPLGANYIDLGLGDFIYPGANLPNGNIGPGSNGQGDWLSINGTFRARELCAMSTSGPIRLL